MLLKIAATSFLFALLISTQECVFVATSSLAYGCAVAAQEHAAYTDYVFAVPEGTQPVSKGNAARL
jgi:hypothetical protein